MPETEFYEYRRDRERDRDTTYSSDDDERYKKTTVRRYKVGPGDRVERVERTERVEEFDTESRRDRPNRRSSNNLLEIDRREYVPDRPRSAFEVVETTRRTDRDRQRDYYNDRDDARTVEKRRDVIERDTDGYGGERSHRVFYEKTKEIDRDVERYPRDRERDRDWDRDNFSRVQRRGERDDQIVVESFSEDRRDDGHGGEVERYRKETEYYEPAPPPPAPIVIRPRATEQKIIVQDAPAPPPVIVPRQQPGVVVIREKDQRVQKREPRHEDEYYYERRERREVGSYRGEREEELAVARFDRRDELDRPHRHHRHHHRHHRGDRRDYASDGEYSSDDSYTVTKTVIRRERSPSQHRLHLAEGALAGAGLGALIGSRRNNQTGELPEHRGRKVLAGAALGALGTEVLKRATSAYNERFGDEEDDRDVDRSRGGNRSRSTSRHHSKLKTGLGIAAAALAVAGAAKYMQSNRIDREERNRGRSLHRYSSGEEGYGSRSVSRKSRKSRSRSVAKVAAGTAAVAGLVHHFRSKSRGRDGKARSHSRLRAAAEIGAAGLAGAAAKKLYDKQKDKKEAEREREEERELSDAEYDHDRRYRRSGSHSRSRSRSAPPAGAARPPYPPSEGADPELGLVEYGAQPLYSDPPYPTAGDAYNHPPHGGYDSAADNSDREGRRRRRHRRRSGDDAEDYADDSDTDRNSKRNRSRSRLRDLAVAGAGAAAAAIGLKKYEDNKKKRDGSTKRDREDDRDEDYDRDRDHDRYRDRNHRHRDEPDDGYDGYYDDHDGNRPPSPPHASGGAFYPPGPPGPAGPSAAGAGLGMQHPNVATTNLNEPYTYNPADYSGYPPPPPGPPPAAAGPGTVSGPPPPGPPPAGPPPAGAAVDPIAPRQPPAPQPGSANDSPLLNNHPPRHDGDHVSFALPLSQAAAAAAALPPGSSRLRKDPVNHRGALPSDNEDSDTHSKAVGFLPLSPQSSRTLRRHHADNHNSQHERPARARGTSDDESADSHSLVPFTGQRSRRLSDPSSNRSGGGELQHRRPRRDTVSDEEDDEEDVIEVLPDRFDSQGRPLRGTTSYGDREQRSSRHLTTRRGDFEYNNPRRNDGWHVRGQWGVAGTDPDGVERIAESMRGIIDQFGSGRRGGLLGVVGGVLEGLARGHGLLDDGRRDAGALGDGGETSSGDERKRKRRSSRGDGRDVNRRRSYGRDRHRNPRHDRRTASVDSYEDSSGYPEQDDYDYRHRDERKRRRSLN